MGLREEMEASGQWLFRWRSYLPVALVLFMLGCMAYFDWPLKSHRLHSYWECVCLAVSFLGLAIRVKTIGHTPKRTSGRNTKHQVAHVLNTSGMYSIVRHPLYLGNFLIWLGVALLQALWWLAVLFVLVYWLYYERIMLAEESFLRKQFGQQFDDWAARTPAFMPRFRQWQPPELSFSWLNVLKREYTALFGIAVAFCGFEVLEHWIVEGRLFLDWPWVVLLGACGVLYAVLRTLKRHTHVLHVAGR